MNYFYTQATASTTWNIQHNMNTQDLTIDVMIITTTGLYPNPIAIKKALPKSVKIMDNNSLVVEFSVAKAGYAKLVKGDGTNNLGSFPEYVINYNIWHPTDHSAMTLISNANKTMSTNQTGWTGGKGQYYTSGITRYYWEVEYSGNCQVGIGSFNWSNMTTMGNTSGHITCGIDTTSMIPVYNSGYVTLNSSTPAGSGNRLMFALEVGPGKLWIGRGGSWWRGDPGLSSDPSFNFSTGNQITLAGVVYDSSATLILKMKPTELLYSIPNNYVTWSL